MGAAPKSHTTHQGARVATSPRFHTTHQDTRVATLPRLHTTHQGACAAIFWPQEKLEKDTWADSCNQELVKTLVGEDMFVHYVPVPKNVNRRNGQQLQCIACMQEDNDQEDREFIQLSCQSCTQDTTHTYCLDCMLLHMNTHRNMTCPNTPTCNRLLPYELVKRTVEGGAFDIIWRQQEALLRDATHVGQVTNSSVVQCIDKALVFGELAPQLYLSGLINKLKDRNPSMKVVTCYQPNCPFQALVRQDHGPVRCYFHPKSQKICTRCSRRWTTGHQCSEDAMHQSAAQLRATKSFPCPHCATLTHRYDGCMHMTCPQCSWHWCWYCVFHFYNVEEHSDKTKAYETSYAFSKEHKDHFHAGAFYNTIDYKKYCHLGTNCPCQGPGF
ncbi:MAG: Rcat domain-containing protein [Bacteroidota bacterium]